jgi:hypothetical protein
MDGQIPCFPILLKVPTIPPIHIEVPVSELYYFRDDVEQEMEKCIESHNPPNGIGD